MAIPSWERSILEVTVSLPIWLREHVEQDSVFGARSHRPLFSLTILLHEIGQLHLGKNLLLLEPPRSHVWYDEEGMYLFYVNAHRQLVSFGMRDHDIRSIGTRYRDPLNIKSGVNQTMWSGWMGTAKLIESAVRRSPYFGKLQTIETEVELQPPFKSRFSDADETWVSHYDIWVTPQQTWSATWGPTYRKEGGTITFRRGVPLRLAHVTVERPINLDHPEVITELVTDIQLYPDIVTAMNEERPFPDAPWSYDKPVGWNGDEEPEWIDVYDIDGEWVGTFPPPPPAERPVLMPKAKPDTNPDRPFVFASEARQQVLKLPPHSEFLMTWK